MSVDGGPRGLEQSCHHPNAGRSEFPAEAPQPRQSTEKAAKKHRAGDVLQNFMRLEGLMSRGTSDEELQQVWRMVFPEVCEILRREGEATTTRDRTNGSNNDKRAQSLENEVRETKEMVRSLAQAIEGIKAKTTEPPKTWASVAAAGERRVGSAGAGEPRLVIPARRAREVLIHPFAEQPDQRTPLEVVRAANQAIGSSEAIAARRLGSGDIILTFKEDAQHYKTSENWIQRAFGPKAQRASRAIVVLAKRLPQRHVKRATSQEGDAFLKELQEGNDITIIKVKARLPKESDYASLLLSCSSVHGAQKLCRDGLLWEAQLFQCEPYYAEAEVRQCYKCYKFGHIARYCKASAKCGLCGGAPHPEGESSCASAGASTKKRCANCGGNHVAWSRQCPAAKEQRARAEIAYRTRPTQFAVANEGDHEGARERDGRRETTLPRAGRQAEEATPSRKRRANGEDQPHNQPRPRGRPRSITPGTSANRTVGPLDRWYDNSEGAPQPQREAPQPQPATSMALVSMSQPISRSAREADAAVFSASQW